jgi:hypothetical protein
MTTVKIYKGSIGKDHLPISLIIGGLGALLVIIPPIVFYLWIGNAESEGTRLADIWFNVGIFIALFLIGSAAYFYLVWRGTREKVTVGEGATTYYTTFFTKTLSALDIDKIMIFDGERPIIIYDVGGDKKRLKLPVWKSNNYIDRLVADLKPINPNIDVVDMCRDADVEVRYEEAEPESAAKQ